MTEPTPTTPTTRPPSALPHTIIRPPAAWPGLGLDELWRFRAICLVLVDRYLKVRYRQTIIGAAWAIIQPFMLMLVFAIFFGILSNIKSDGIPYPLFVYIGIMLWQVIGKVLSEGSLSVSANSTLVTKIYFPRAYFPISSALGSLVDLAFALLALVALLLFYGIVPGWGVVLLPLLTAIGIAAALGFAFWVSALNVTYRDVAQLLPFLVQLWFFISPIIYPSSGVPQEYRMLYGLNPYALMIDGYRWALAGTPAPSIMGWLLGTSVAALLLITGYVAFRRRDPGLPDYL